MDDQALVPMAPELEPREVEEQAVDAALETEKHIAAAYFHPAWDGVVDEVNQLLGSLAGFPDPNLIADEYKIDALARQKASTIVTNLMERVRHAVESVESTERGK